MTVIPRGQRLLEMELLGTAPTRRELEVLSLASDGLSNEEIARAMCITVDTVKRHVQNARARFGAASRGHACCEALRRGLIE